jgi:hypothetical protein
MVFNEVELEPRITVHGIEINGEFKQAVLEAITMNELKHTVRVHKTKQRLASKWCQKQFGYRHDIINNRQGIWQCFWEGTGDVEHYRFHFRNERDMIWFALQFAS